MNFRYKNLNNLISKDDNTALAAAKRIIDECDINSFIELCEKSEFLFDFIKEKINSRLVLAANCNNFRNTFKFIKVYNYNFEDFIVKIWVKFANEDLTDEILEIFKNGCNEEKTYAAGYFYYINDPLALDYLKEHAFSDFEPLAQNSARALAKFNDTELYNKAINIIEADFDDFDKYKYINFLTAYGKKEAFNALFNYLKTSYTKGFIASSILYLKSFYEIIENGEENKAIYIFDAILTSYPEEISLDTIFDFEIFEFIKFLTGKIQNNTDDSYAKRLILKAKYKFNLISKEDIYTFDLNKNIKKEINEISSFLNTIDINLFKGLEKELYSDDKNRILEVFEVILNFGKKEFIQAIVGTVKNSKYEDVIAEGIKILKTFDSLNCIQKDEILEKITNKNIKAMVLNTFA